MFQVFNSGVQGIEQPGFNLTLVIHVWNKLPPVFTIKNDIIQHLISIPGEPDIICNPFQLMFKQITDYIRFIVSCHIAYNYMRLHPFIWLLHQPHSLIHPTRMKSEQLHGITKVAKCGCCCWTLVNLVTAYVI